MMDTLVFATYILVWPIVSFGVLGLIVYATLRDFRNARREGRDVV